MTTSSNEKDVASARVTAIISVPVGSIVSYPGNNPPPGWLLCDGSPIDSISHPELHNLVGNSVPDLRGRFVLGTGNGYGLTGRGLNQTGGEEYHALNANEMPSHNHTFGVGGGDRDPGEGKGVSDGWAAQSTDYTVGTTSAGSGWGHNNMPPFYVLTYIIKY